MTRVVLSGSIERDLDQIADWIAQESPTRAVRVIEAIEQEFLRIGRGPLLYPIRKEIGPEARISIVGRYALLFRIVDADAVRIERVVFAGRDLPTLFG